VLGRGGGERVVGWVMRRGQKRGKAVMGGNGGGEGARREGVSKIKGTEGWGEGEKEEGDGGRGRTERGEVGGSRKGDRTKGEMGRGRGWEN